LYNKTEQKDSTMMTYQTSSPWEVIVSWQRMTYKLSKLGQTDPVLVCDQSSSVGLRSLHTVLQASV